MVNKKTNEYNSNGERVEDYFERLLKEKEEGKWQPLTKKEFFELAKKLKEEAEENKKNENND